MILSFSETLQRRLDEAKSLQLNRTLRLRNGLDFSSNDYLGFSEDSDLRSLMVEPLKSVLLGASGSRLLRGNLASHEEIERNLARFCGTEASLLFSSGYQANLGLLSALLTDNDQVFSDECNHASIIDGIRLSRATKHIFPHNDVDALRETLRANPNRLGISFIVTESLFSMEGDFAPLAELVKLALEYQALLIVDESHATGVYGDFNQKGGGGIVQALGLRPSVFATIHTGGKALGVGGAWVGGSMLLRDYLINFSRPFIFSTAVVPAIPMMLDGAIRYWSEIGLERASSIRDRARRLLARLQASLEPNPLKIVLPKTASTILPIIVGSNERANRISRSLQELGFDIRAIRPPTVPIGTARIRITINWNTPESALDRFADSLTKILKAEHA